MVLLRESSRVLGHDIDVDAVVDAGRAPVGGNYGFPAAAELLAFASAANRAANPAMVAGGDAADLPEALADARDRLVGAVGAAGLLEAAATVAAFNGLVRVADGTGIELDDAMIVASSEVRTELGLDSLVGAANTRRLADTPVLAEHLSGDEDRVRSLFADGDSTVAGAGPSPGDTGDGEEKDDLEEASE